jgi:poly-gamma-glutamate capsule biosynthesis protein CapA/YwtB (metallophosphatase superfamily)
MIRPVKIFRLLMRPIGIAVIILVFTSFSPVLHSGEKNPEIQNDSIKELTLLFMGDIMQHMPQVEAAYNKSDNTYNYDSCFGFVKPIISRADIAIANFETTLAGKPFSGYPAFSSPDGLVNGLLNAGIDLVGTANNHCCDRGKKGIERTILMLDSLGLAHMGTYCDAETYHKNYPLIINKKGFRLAFLNYTYGTNGIGIPDGNIVNLIDEDRIARDIKASHDSLADKVIIFMHWGEEYQRLPNTFQKETADFCFAKGADIIIGSHPHVIQPMEWRKADSMKKDQLVVWSLGNTVSNQRNRYTDGGAMVEITLLKTGRETHISRSGYFLNWVNLPGYSILPVTKVESDTNLIKPSHRGQFSQFVSDSRRLLNSHNLNIEEIKIPWILLPD